MLSRTTLVPLAQNLDAMEAVLTRAETHVALRRLAPEALLGDRLFPDMYDFTRQVQTACACAAGIAAILSGAEPLPPDHDATGFAMLKAQVARTAAFVRATDAVAVDAMSGKDVTFTIGERAVTMNAVDYAHRFALPNFYFHATVAYALLRTNGLDLGKADFLGRIMG